MARLRTGRHRSTLGPVGRYSLELELGPTRGDPRAASMEELELAWEVHGPALMSSTRMPGTRPWAWWQFEREEPCPRGTEPLGAGDYAAQVIRLAELGELAAEELAEFEEDAVVAKLRIGTDSERLSGAPFWDANGRYPESRENRRAYGGLRSTDVDAVLLWARVSEAAPR